MMYASHCGYGYYLVCFRNTDMVCKNEFLKVPEFFNTASLLGPDSSVMYTTAMYKNCSRGNCVEYYPVNAISILNFFLNEILLH